MATEKQPRSLVGVPHRLFTPEIATKAPSFGGTVWFWPDHYVPLLINGPICKCTETKFSTPWRKKKMHLENLSDYGSTGMLLTSEKRSWSTVPWMRQCRSESSNLFCVSAVTVRERLHRQNNCLVLALKPPFLEEKYWTNTVSIKIPPICSKAKSVLSPQECIEENECRHHFNTEPAPNCFMLKGQEKIVCKHNERRIVYVPPPH